ncbi:YALI0D03740p [Cyberlindnera jadinii]|uniref:YALI0D03740p n=1 Tax=Cyberlindnera jadinii (strain ATCC 18201 / CBS 1600 / BCRC 20928 / JCM 3617 / NBRC 0987 / NRRL Y-1542) TaxID=983966 RepID=A0A0H5C587_CYBJN|nr:YALI0D03740p [Cyberlindnera jadinii]
MFARYSFSAFVVATALAQICAVTDCHGVCGPMIVAARACAENSSDDGPWDNDCLCSADSDFMQNYDVCMSCGISLWQVYGSYLDGPLAACETLLTSPTGSVTPCETSEATATEEVEETTSAAEETSEEAEEAEETTKAEETTEVAEETTGAAEETTEEAEVTTGAAEETTAAVEETFNGMGASLRLDSVLALVCAAFTGLMMF